MEAAIVADEDEVTDIEDEILALLEFSNAIADDRVNDPDTSCQMALLCEQLLTSIQSHKASISLDENVSTESNFIRTSIPAYSNKSTDASKFLSVRTVLGSLSSAQISKLPPLLTNLMSDRVDLSQLLPATQDELANEEAMGKIAITLTTKAFLAAELYVELVVMPGAWGAGLIDVGSLSALSALLRRWNVECGGNQNTDPGDVIQEGKKRRSAPLKDPWTKRTSTRQRTVVADMDDSLSEEEDDDTYGEFMVEEEDEGDSPILSRRQLIMGGLRTAQALGKAILGDELVAWSCEAREAFVDSAITALLATAALLAGPTKTMDRALNSVGTSVVRSLTAVLKGCLALGPIGSIGDDIVAELESESERADRNHDTAVAILRGLYPSLVLQVEVPQGQKGKEAARDAGIGALQGFIDVITKSYRHRLIAQTPSRTPKTPGQENATPRFSSISKNATTPSTARSARKKRVSFGGLGDVSTEKAEFPSLKPSSTTRLSTGLTPAIQGDDRPRPILSAVLGMLQKLATFKGLERASVRSHVTDTLCKLLPSLPDVERTCFLRFLIHLSHSKVALHRLTSVELISSVLTEPWLWRDHSGQSMSPVSSATMTPSTRSSFSPIVECSAENMPLTLLRVLQGRLLDRTPGVRGRTGHCISGMLKKVSQESLADLQSDLDPSFSFASSIEITACSFAAKLRKRAAVDEGATVRKAAINALVAIILFNESTQSMCSESDVTMLSLLCSDASVSVRKVAADALTTLLFYFSGTKYLDMTYVLEDVWPTSVLPLVADAETTCASKAVDLAFRTVIEPLIQETNCTATPSESPATSHATTAWRLLGRVSERSFEEGASRGELGSLRILARKLSDVFTEEVAQQALLSVRDSIVRVLEEDYQGIPAFASDGKLEAQLKGAWCLLEALADQEKELSGLAKLMRKRSFNLSFLSSSWETMFRFYHSGLDESLGMVQTAMKSCLKVLSKWARYLQVDDAQRMITVLKRLIGTFELPTCLLGSAISALIALMERAFGDKTKQECSSWISQQYKSCEDAMASFVSSTSQAQRDDSKIVRALFVAGEVSTIGFRTDEDSLTCSSATDKRKAGASSVDGMYQPPSSRLLDLMQAMLSRDLPTSDLGRPPATPESVRAHAFLALGKLCLRDETLAKKSLTILARELRQTGPDVCPSVQSNALLVLGDLCVRYTNLVDRYLPVMAACLQSGISNEDRTTLFDVSEDRNSLVRKHAVLVLSGLLLQDYIKWRGLLFQRFLVASADRDDGVARLAELTLCGPLLTRYPKLFFNNFVESLFVLNRCTAHPVYAAAASSGDNGGGITVGFDDINLSGDAGKAERIHMYGLMLSHVSDEEKIGLTARLANEVLGAALETDGDLSSVCRNPRPFGTATTREENAFNVLSDAFYVLTSPVLQVSRGGARDEGQELDDSVGENRTQTVATARGKLLSKISRKQLVEMVLPILCNFKAILQDSCSPLLKDLMRYMVVIFRAYKVEVREFLVSDPTLLQELEYDARHFKKTQADGTPTGAVVLVS